jgi:hypothetical protein
VFDTADDSLGATTFEKDSQYNLRDRSVAVFRTRPLVEPTGPTALQLEAIRRAAQRAGAPANIGKTL